MASFSTTKTFVDGVSVAASDLNAITSQLSLANGAISDRTAAGAAVDADLFLVLKSGGGLQQMTALQLKTYLGQVFIPSGVATAGSTAISLSAPTVPSGPTGLIASVTFTTTVGRKAMGWVSSRYLSASDSAIQLWVYRQDSVLCGTQSVNGKAGLYLNNAFQWVDTNTLGGSTTYYLLGQAGVATGTCDLNTLSGVQM